MRKKLILTIILIILAIVATLTIISINNKITSPEEKTILEKIFDTKPNIKENNPNTTEIITKENSQTTSSGGGGDGSSTEEHETPTELICKMQEIQYSLKNFEEEITCLENSTGICTTLHAICSVQIYNLDANSTEDFEIKYSIINSDKEFVNSTNTKINVKLEYPETIETEFLIQDMTGVDENSECKIQMLTIPRKEICY